MERTSIFIGSGFGYFLSTWISVTKTSFEFKSTWFITTGDEQTSVALKCFWKRIECKIKLSLFCFFKLKSVDESFQFRKKLHLIYFDKVCLGIGLFSINHQRREREKEKKKMLYHSYRATTRVSNSIWIYKYGQCVLMTWLFYNNYGTKQNSRDQWKRWICSKRYVVELSIVFLFVFEWTFEILIES